MAELSQWVMEQVEFLDELPASESAPESPAVPGTAENPDKSWLVDLGDPVSDSPSPEPQHPPDRTGQTANSSTARPELPPGRRWRRKA